MRDTSTLPPSPTEASDESASAPIRVLVVDDEPSVREAAELRLTHLGHDVVISDSAQDARQAVARERFDLVLLDLRLSEASGLDLIPELLDHDPDLTVVVMTAFGTVETAVEAMRLGAFDYLEKPLDGSAVRLITRRTAERQAFRKRIQVLEEAARDHAPAPILDSKHPRMARALATARDVAGTDATVLIRGENGTGKGVLARAIHDWSQRAGKPFAVVNCPSLSAELLRSELFGHVKGAFTGAVETKVGKIQFADSGTLFLDEVGEMSADIQPRMLRFLQDKEYERVGDPESRTADVRLIAATNSDLEKGVESGRFRSDLYYRLNVIEIEIAPLRGRPDDIEVLARSFLEFFSARHGKRIEGFTDDALRTLRGLSWPGNVRELQNAVERAVILAHGKRIGVTAFPSRGGLMDRVGALPDQATLPTLEGMEERYIRHVMEVTDSVERAAEVLGVAPSTLWRRRRKYGI